MPPFRRVDHAKAGAAAVGILVPPGRRTAVIIRPRALTWDLVPARVENGVRAFCQFDRDEAAGVARTLQQELAHLANAEGDPFVMLSSPASPGFQIGVKSAAYYWIVCARTPGKAYEALQFATQTEAEEAAARLRQFLCPKRDANQEYYFNTQHFG